MVRDIARKVSVTRGGVIMTQREATLIALGVQLAASEPSASDSYDPSAIASLSGYGAFTPITVRSYTVPKNAELERNQPRD